MKRPHWLEICRGPRIKVEHVNVIRAGTDVMTSIGWWTRVICKCSKCGKIFEANPVPGKWTLEEIKEM